MPEEARPILLCRQVELGWPDEGRSGLSARPRTLAAMSSRQAGSTPSLHCEHLDFVGRAMGQSLVGLKRSLSTPWPMEKLNSKIEAQTFDRG